MPGTALANMELLQYPEPELTWGPGPWPRWPILIDVTVRFDAIASWASDNETQGHDTAGK
jgi:hypothetical protein